ncbi:2-(1,2-epoxy-1,2-dihydrophenyl)acetyl-CoA isomerase PaaG [Emcibacter nanhaiensis]|uniref:2-(1,2-epoxy-1,2-dihydrophenyl)acetyl-CoA isomerase n=1 Tax=Emcibacter nanhaiensis TaxID=1505037 RepID=A0A501PC28_9PROT|nr:2-(1,2-epoxy-1,2-dihydrophenyl)acetyl-CoA isomerase PaaG [Emcibacter nanhaiensis]TPD57536.1 2-(1,2-epoxy-1,2-dihydrophenyl)acetyl-CoA isomerase [Emcibacter nanhaiensis]
MSHSTNFDTIEFEINDGLAVLTLNRPDSLNSFNKQMHEEMQQALDILTEAEGLRCVLLTGNGRGFCAGQDLSDAAVLPGGDLGESIENYYNPMIRKISALPVPVICAVNGVAAGAGANIAFACDIVLAAKSAKFIQAFCKIGLVPDSGGTYMLPRLVGHARAMGLALLGDAVGAEQAENWGMIWKAVDDEALREEALKLAQNLATQPTKGLGLIKKALQASLGNDLDSQLEMEKAFQREAGYSDDYREGVEAFLEKRKPEFTGK